MTSLLPEIAVEVEIAFSELAESLGLHQDDIPNADYVLTKLALTCYKKGMRHEASGLKYKKTTKPQFRAVREDDTPLVVVVSERDLSPD